MVPEISGLVFEEYKVIFAPSAAIGLKDWIRNQIRAAFLFATKKTGLCLLRLASALLKVISMRFMELS